MSRKVTLSPTEESFYSLLFAQTSQGQNTVGAGDAVVVLRQSSLPDTVLHQIWEIADAENQGELSQEGFYTALKLVALCQNGHEPSTDNLGITTPLPLLGEAGQQVLSALQATVGWAIKPDEKAKYDAVFDKLEPEDNRISGKKAKQVLVNSKLPTQILSKIWELSDIDKDGRLDRDEFAVAMHYVFGCLDGRGLPDQLPYDMIPPARRHTASAPATTSSSQPVTNAPSAPAATAPTPAPAPQAPTPTPTATAASVPAPAAVTPAVPTTEPAHADWVVTAEEAHNYEAFFKSADKDNDGVVSGAEVMGIFMSSRLPKNVLAHIWNLADTNKSGMLNFEQFALAMHLISRKVQGHDVPEALEPNMVPPSMRSAAASPLKAASPAKPAAAATGPGSRAATNLSSATPSPSATAHSSPKASPPTRRAPAPAAAAASEPPLQPGRPAPAPPTAAPGPASSTDPELEKAKLLHRDMEHQKAALLSDKASKVVSAQETALQIKKQQAVNASLATELAKMAAEIAQQEQEHAKAQAELAALQAEEGHMRNKLRESRAQLVELLEQIKLAKSEQAKTQTSTARLAQSKQKVDESLRQYGAQVAPKKAAAPQPKDDLPDTQGMSFEDYFGAPPTAPVPMRTTSTPARRVVSHMPASTPAPDPFATDPFKPAQKKVLSPWG